MDLHLWNRGESDFLGKLTNEEIYYLISSLLSLGDPGFTQERLYLSFDEQSLDGISHVRFLLVTSTLIDKKEMTEYHLGKIDADFDDIEIYSGLCLPLVLDPLTAAIDDVFVSASLNNRNYSNVFRPMTFI